MTSFGSVSRSLLARTFYQIRQHSVHLPIHSRKLNIALSSIHSQALANKVSRHRMSGVIDLVSDDDEPSTNRPSTINMAAEEDEDEDLKRAIALSLQDQSEMDDVRDIALRPSKDVSMVAETTKPSIGGLLNLDRKAMEAERLARLKRKRNVENSDQQQQQQHSKLPSSASTRITPPPPRKRKTSPAKPSPAVNTNPPSAISRPPPPAAVTHPSFPTPQVLLTSQPSRFTTIVPDQAPRQEIQRQRQQQQNFFTSISLPDILKPPSQSLTLKSAFLSSFIADLDWALPHFNTRTTTFLLILHAQNAQHRSLLTADFAGLPNVKLILPETLGAGNMHSKLMVLFYQGVSSSSGDTATATAASNDEICRVVIPSANLIPQDWGVGGVMENVLFVVDLPLKNNQKDKTGTKDKNVDEDLGPPSTTRFEKQLKQMLRAMEVPDSVIQKLERFDFDATRDVEFVYSRSASALLSDEGAEIVPGGANGLGTALATGAGAVAVAGTGTGVGKGTRKTTSSRAKKENMQSFFDPKRVKNSEGKTDATETTNITDSPKMSMATPDDPARTGLLSLQDTIISLGLDIPSNDPGQLPLIDYITSSLGNLTLPFIRQLFRAACGQLDPRTAVAVGGPKRAGFKPDGDDQVLDKIIRNNLRIYFPTAETVHRSKGGRGVAGTICFQKKWWESNDLIRDVLRDCIGIRNDGILMHSKILYVRFKTPKRVKHHAGGEKLYAGWAYVGSANLSESAWGRIVSDSKLKQPKLSCRNWESGVIIPVEVQPKDRNSVADAVGHQTSGDEDMRAESITSSHVKTKSDHDLKEEAPTSRKDVKAKVKQGKRESAPHEHRNSKSGRPAVGDEVNEMLTGIEDVAARSGDHKHVNDGLELSSLSEVFSGKVPVPVQHPSSSHVARQQNPWFFMEE